MGREKTGEQLSCDNCGENIYVPLWKTKENKNHFCSRSCHNTFQTNRVKRECVMCSQVFSVIPSSDKRYCSTECGYDGRADRGNIEYRCDNCGKEFTEHKYRVEVQENNFCSNECTSEWRSEQLSGNNNPRFRDGKYRNFGNNWLDTRELIWNRAEGNCEWCGLSDEHNGRRLSVHHIIPRKEFIEHDNLSVEMSNFKRNLIALCQTCHQSAETGEGYYPTI